MRRLVAALSVLACAGLMACSGGSSGGSSSSAPSTTATSASSVSSSSPPTPAPSPLNFYNDYAENAANQFTCGDTKQLTIDATNRAKGFYSLVSCTMSDTQLPAEFTTYTSANAQRAGEAASVAAFEQLGVDGCIAYGNGWDGMYEPQTLPGPGDQDSWSAVAASIRAFAPDGTLIQQLPIGKGCTG